MKKLMVPLYLLAAKRQKGVTLIEYALIAALIAVVSILILTAVGEDIAALFGGVSTSLQEANK
jgi:pilus assembly protein Flp/PilA